ncbi:MAG: Tryptophan-tRNA ligase [Parcubacteria group bacterium GW2011_GWA1_42_7]|nr:MAG: Tryptophan-tRNA ligase [Parcubacteria group bacterium GW2011_GWA1_42_7]
METIFSGVQPSGALHLGNYLGAIKNWVELQNQHRSVFCVVDLHALTVPQDPKTFREKILSIAKIYLAAGIDPEKSIIFIQSHVKEHAELCWILNTISRIPELERMTQFKEKAERHKKDLNMGLFDYPVLMAADILLYKTNAVPVGEDQIQHVELARTLAERFNNYFGETFVIPKAFVRKEGARIMGLDDPSKKMSKSAPSAANYITLTDSPEIIREKIKKAVTDSGKEIIFNPIEKPAIANLLTIYSLASGRLIEDLQKQYANAAGYAEFKNDLSEAVVEFLRPLQEKLKELDSKEDVMLKILNDGAQKARQIASQTMKEVKDKIGLI